MSPLRLMWVYFTAQRWRFIGSVLLAALTIISTVSLLGVSAWLIARSAQMPAIMELNVAIVGVRTFALLRSATRYSERLLSHDATFRSLTTIRMALYEKLEALTPLRLSSYSRGDLVSRVVTDVDEIQNLPLRIVIPIASSVIASLFSIALMAWLLPVAGLLLAIVLLIASTLVPWLTTRNLAHLEIQVASQRGKLTEQIIEHFAGLTDIVMLGVADHSLNSIKATNETLMRTERANAIRLGSANAVLVLLQGLALLTSVATSISATQDNSLSTVTMVVVSLLPLAAFESVMGLPLAVTSLARVRGSAQRLHEVLASPTTTDLSSSKQISSTHIDVNDVSLRWPDSAHDVIADLTFVAPPKSRIGIVGASGSGKSTIVNMLNKFLPVHSGSYQLGSANVSELSGERVRQHVVATSHDAHIFATSIRENLLLAAHSPITDAQLWEILRAVEMESWVNSLPAKLDTIVGENGSSISGGQRQRLLMARMFVNNPDVWVLDEPTEHLDTTLAHSLMSAITQKSAESTLIIVSHRPADVDGSDTIVSL